MTEIERLRREILERMTMMGRHDQGYTLRDAQREERQGKAKDRQPTAWVPFAVLLDQFEAAVRSDD
jgi:hypothetical protein